MEVAVTELGLTHHPHNSAPPAPALSFMQLVESKEQRWSTRKEQRWSMSNEQRGADKERAQLQVLARVHYIQTRVVSDFPTPRQYIVR